jgi:Sec-independent protein translocase protein TatA
MMAKDKEQVEGGQLGIAKRALEGRKSRLDEAIEQSEKGAAPTPQKEKPKEKESTRPPMSKKWYE